MPPEHPIPTVAGLAAVAWCEGSGPLPHPLAFDSAVEQGWLVQDPCWRATDEGRRALAAASGGESA